jgi:hypothetical protein
MTRRSRGVLVLLTVAAAPLVLAAAAPTTPFPFPTSPGFYTPPGRTPSPSPTTSQPATTPPTAQPAMQPPPARRQAVAPAPMASPAPSPTDTPSQMPSDTPSGTPAGTPAASSSPSAVSGATTANTGRSNLLASLMPWALLPLLLLLIGGAFGIRLLRNRGGMLSPARAGAGVTVTHRTPTPGLAGSVAEPPEPAVTSDPFPQTPPPPPLGRSTLPPSPRSGRWRLSAGEDDQTT